MAEFKVATKVIAIDPAKIRLLEMNARYMTHEQFMRLVANVKRDGVLTQIPFGWRLHDDQTREPILDEEGGAIYEVLSGNHRTQAAVAAGLHEIDLQVTDQYLEPDQRAAIQLSHNEISGQDDPAVLKVIYDNISGVEWRIYSGLDDKTLKLLDDVSPDSISEANLTFQNVTMVFLPSELEEAKAAWEAAVKELAGSKAVWLLRWQEYDRWMDAVETASKSYGIKNVATAANVVLRVFERHLDDLRAGWMEGEEPNHAIKEVPVDVVFGSHFVPPATAAALRKVVDRMIGRGEIDSDHRHQALLKLAQMYLEA